MFLRMMVAFNPVDDESHWSLDSPGYATVGTELRITNKGEIILSNPELELSREERAADATIIYKFDPNRGEHSLRLVEPFADHKHMKTHKPGD